MTAEKMNRAGKKGGEKTGIIILSAMLLVLVGVIVYLLMSHRPQEERRNVVVTPNNVEEVIEKMTVEEFVAPGYYTVTMNYIWHFETSDAVSYDAYVENIAENTNPVYFDVFLAGNEGDAVYKSPVLPQGSSLQEIVLDRKLNAGTYDCVAVYHLVDNDQKTVGTLRVTVTLIIEG